MKTSLLIVLLTAFAMSSCANNKNLQSRTVEEYYTPTGVEKYFLADIPGWANFDQSAGCFKKSSLRYFNLDALMKSYALSYNLALQMQASFNEEYLKIKNSEKSRAPMLKEEELLFYKVSEKVNSKIIFFDPPTYKRINMVWLDEIAGESKKEEKLKKFINSPVMEEGVPILVSFCMTRDEVEAKYPNLNAKMITAEMFSIYDKQGIANPGFKLDLGAFFKPDQKLYFYSQKSFVPSDRFVGTLKILNY